MKICFLGAGSTVFAKNVLGDCIVTKELGSFEIALHDIDANRLDESYAIIKAINLKYGEPATISKCLDRREALKGSDYIIDAIQVGGYEPCTVTDFEIPKKYGLRQTIADTIGIGGIFRSLRTIAVLEEFAKDIEELCPNALFLNYTNPMAILTGYMLMYTKVKVVGLCHSVQTCVKPLLKTLKLRKYLDTCDYKIGGINHQAWLLEIKDNQGRDIYPEIRDKSLRAKRKHIYYVIPDYVRHDMMKHFGYYITESSEHTSEYLPYFIKNRTPELIKKYRIPLDEYPRRCRLQIKVWNLRKLLLTMKKKLSHHKSKEFGSRIIEGAYTNKGFEFNGSCLNTDKIISNLPSFACIEVPMVAKKEGFIVDNFGEIPEHLAAINKTNINIQYMTILAAKHRSMHYVYLAAALDPHTSSELTIDEIMSMCDDLYNEHYKGGWLPKYS